jgi:hypothetical protein
MVREFGDYEFPLAYFISSRAEELLRKPRLRLTESASGLCCGMLEASCVEAQLAESNACVG